jgi:hypothetical protein
MHPGGCPAPPAPTSPARRPGIPPARAGNRRRSPSCRGRCADSRYRCACCAWPARTRSCSGRGLSLPGVAPAACNTGARRRLRNNHRLGCLLHGVQLSTWSSSMSRARIVALSFVAALALSSGALAQGGGGGGGGAGGGSAGGAGSGAGGANGASGTTGTSSGRASGPSGNSVTQPSGGQSGPKGNGAAQSPGSTGQNSINSPGTGVGPGSTGTNR